MTKNELAWSSRGKDVTERLVLVTSYQRSSQLIRTLEALEQSLPVAGASLISAEQRAPHAHENGGSILR